MISSGSFASLLLLPLKLLINPSTNHWWFWGTLWPQAFWYPLPFLQVVADTFLLTVATDCSIAPIPVSWVMDHTLTSFLHWCHCHPWCFSSCDPSFWVPATAVIISVFIWEVEGRDWGKLIICPAFGKGIPASPHHCLKPVIGSGKLFFLNAIPSEFKWKDLQMWKVWFQSYIFSKYFIRENKTGKGQCASRKQSIQLLVITSPFKHFQLDTVPSVQSSSTSGIIGRAWGPRTSRLT